MNDCRFTLRDMLLADIPEVQAIENQCQSHPWSEIHFKASIESSHQAYVLEDPAAPEIVAFAITSTVADEAELLNIAVAPSCQRQGVGHYLLNFLCDSFEPSIQSFFLEVRGSNQAAIALYRKLEFNEVGLRRNYYPSLGGREDAVIMARNLYL